MTTPILDLDEWEEAQAQPQVPVNTALRWLECFASLSVISQSISTPPGSPADGDRYIVGPAATGVWAGREGEIALYLATEWGFKEAPGGTVAYVQDDADQYVYMADDSPPGWDLL